MWFINRTVIHHAVHKSFTVSSHGGNTLLKALLLLIDREAACNIQDVRQWREIDDESTHRDPC
jgi:hypothetical protein